MSIYFNLITIFPHIFDSYFKESMIQRAVEQGIIKINVWNLRDFSFNRHRTVDGRSYGGGPGMVLKIEPLAKALGSILRSPKSKIQNPKLVLLSPAGKQFTSKLAADFAKHHNHFIFICGRYEGVDERIFQVLKAKSYKLEVISIGPYVLSGGELPAMVVMETICRHLPGFLGKDESLEEKRLGVGVPVYTRPEVFQYKAGSKKYELRVPRVLLSGNHKKIKEWRKKHKK